MPDFWLDDEGTYYYEQSSEALVSEDGKYLFKVTVAAPATPGVGEPMGLLLSLTYAA